LVIVIVFDAGPGKIAIEGLPVFVGHAGTAVQKEDLHRRLVADPLGPYIEGAFGRLDGDHLHSAAQDIVASGVIQIVRRTWSDRLYAF
jgi:hypothetical protein